MLDFISLHTSATSANFLTVIYTLLIAFGLGLVIALTYDRTFRGLSYSRNYLQSLVLSPIVAATVIQAIGDSVARGLGMLAALAIIRFRTVFKDPRDIIFMFSSLAAGIACGLYGFSIAILGTLTFSLACFILYFTPITRSTSFDGMLRFNLENDKKDKETLNEILSQYCKTFALITLRDIQQGNRLDYAYHIKLKAGVSNEAFLDNLKKIKSIKSLNLMLQETTVEL